MTTRRKLKSVLLIVGCPLGLIVCAFGFYAAFLIACDPFDDVQMWMAKIGMIIALALGVLCLAGLIGGFKMLTAPADAPAVNVLGSMRTHVKVVGIVMIVVGGLGLLAGVVMLLVGLASIAFEIIFRASFIVERDEAVVMVLWSFSNGGGCSGIHGGRGLDEI